MTKTKIHFATIMFNVNLLYTNGKSIYILSIQCGISCLPYWFRNVIRCTYLHCGFADKIIHVVLSPMNSDVRHQKYKCQMNGEWKWCDQNHVCLKFTLFAYIYGPRYHWLLTADCWPLRWFCKNSNMYPDGKIFYAPNEFRFIHFCFFFFCFVVELNRVAE